MSLLDHVAGLGYDMDDAAVWLPKFSGKMCDAAFILVSVALEFSSLSTR